MQHDTAINQEEEDGFSESVNSCSLKIASWNCQGLENPWTVQRLREIVRDISPDIIFLMETKNSKDFVLEKFENLDYEYYELVSPTGHGAGGLALLWKQDIKLDVLDANANVIDTSIKVEGKSFFASFVYADTDRMKRRAIWDHLIELSNARDQPWYITGDFNDLLTTRRRLEARYDQKALSQT